MKTYGTIRYEPGVTRGAWLIDCEPQVRSRLKRVFARIEGHGELRVTDTLEMCRELDWFLDRYPMTGDVDRLKVRATQHKARVEQMANILAADYQAGAIPLALPLRDYQRIIPEAVLCTGGLLDADQVGLGKTASAIGMIIDPRARPALVVTLTHLPMQWQNELAKFAPSLRTHILKSAQPYDIMKAMRGRRKVSDAQASLPGVPAETLPDVIITSYSKLAGWADELAGKVKSATFDEVQELRHHTSQKYRAAKHIAHAADYRLGLSATPIFNYGGEIWSVLDVLCPDSLGTREEFIREWCGGDSDGDKPRVRNPQAFGMYVREQGLMVRRTREEVGRELPELTKVPHTISADTAALDKISKSAAELARIILAQGETHKGAKWQAAEEFSNLLRQATGIAKAPYVAEFVRMLVESGEKVVLYAWHRSVYDIWLDTLKDLKPAMYTGTESPTQKAEAARRFIDGETPLLIMSLRSGAGLDGLQGHCRVVVFGELDWSPAVHEQAIGRVHRDGQAEKVIAYFLIADHGADPTIADVLALKKAQSDGLRDPNADIIERLDTGGGHVRRLAETYLGVKEAA